jgi:ATP-dependent exoDNAse (exonuclease V) alpha subunit
VGLGEEGFSEILTVDRLLFDLGRKHAELDGRTVLVVDEAAMVGTRKLAPLLEHAQGAGTKVILVGDDRQFASVDAGGGFRALRLRLGASELTENRRQVEAWEQQAIEDVRAGRVEEAIGAYAEHDRIQAFDTRDDRDKAVLADWWQAPRRPRGSGARAAGRRRSHHGGRRPVGAGRQRPGPAGGG